MVVTLLVTSCYIIYNEILTREMAYVFKAGSLREKLSFIYLISSIAYYWIVLNCVHKLYRELKALSLE